MQYNILTVFIVGILVGNFLDTITALTMIFLLIMVRNKPLPHFLGGTEPNTIMMNFLIEMWFFVSRINRNNDNIIKNNNNDTSIKIEEVPEQHQYLIENNNFPSHNYYQNNNRPRLNSNLTTNIIPENNKPNLKIKINNPN